jgi:uncharacterized protein (TIGR00251 family)
LRADELSWYRLAAGAIVLSVRLTPKADRDRTDGIGVLADGRAVGRVRVRAVPEDGAANVALVGVIAKAFGRPKSAVAIIAGAGQRLKQVRVNGDPAELKLVAERWGER